MRTSGESGRPFERSWDRDNSGTLETCEAGPALPIWEGHGRLAKFPTARGLAKTVWETSDFHGLMWRLPIQPVPIFIDKGSTRHSQIPMRLINGPLHRCPWGEATKQVYFMAKVNHDHGRGPQGTLKPQWLWVKTNGTMLG